MPQRYGKKSDVRQIGKKAPLKFGGDPTSSETCLGMALQVVLASGAGVYLKADRDMSQVKVKVYQGDDTCEGWFDLGQAVLEDMTDLIEEIVGANASQDFWDRASARLAVLASKGQKRGKPTQDTTQTPIVPQNGSHEATEA